MSIPVLLALILLAAIGAYGMGYRRSMAVAKPQGGRRSLHSLPAHHGTFSAFWTIFPALMLVALWFLFAEPLMSKATWASLPDSYQQMDEGQRSLVMNQIRSASANDQASGLDAELVTAAEKLHSLRQSGQYILAAACLLIVMLSAALALRQITVEFRARNQVERVVQALFFASSLVAVLTTFGIVISVLFESILFFKSISPIEFLFGTHWSPQIAMRADQAGSSGGFGAVPLFVGTLLISTIAMVVAAPLGLMSAIYLSEYAAPNVRSIVKPVLEVLAGIPTVVYGFFAALTLAPFVRDTAASMGWSVSSESALATGLVMGIMVIPFISSIADDVIHAVPQAMRDGSYGLGATRSETIVKVIIPAALPGIVGGMMLAISRAIGETMIVVMAAGLSANMTFNPMESVTTITVQIVTLLTGDQEFDSPKTLAAFALGLLLFVVTLALNFVALHIVNKYREQYE